MGAKLCHGERAIETVSFIYDEEESDEFPLRRKKRKSTPASFSQNFRKPAHGNEKDMQSTNHLRLRNYKSSPMVLHRVEKSTAKANSYRQKQSDDLFKSTPDLNDHPRICDYKSSPQGSHRLEKFTTTANSEKQKQSNNHLGMYKSAPNLFSHSHNQYSNTMHIDNLGMPSRAFSLRDTILAHKNDMAEFTIGEHEAKLYEDIVENDTLNHLTNAIRSSEMTLDTTWDISEEIVRQGDVIDKANNDIHTTEQEIDESHYRLKGMKSIRHKIANIVWHKKPEVQVFDDIVLEEQDSKKIRRRSIADVVTHRKSLLVSKKQQKIHEGVRHLNLIMDKIQHNTLDVADEIKRQDKRLGKLSRRMDRTDNKIKSQSSLIHSIRSD